MGNVFKKSHFRMSFFLLLLEVLKFIYNASLNVSKEPIFCFCKWYSHNVLCIYFDRRDKKT